jgi:carbonic anhydrase
MPSFSSRRAFLARTGAAASSVVPAACAPVTPGQPPAHAPAAPTLCSPARPGGDAALDCLVQGNLRYVAGQMVYPDQTAERRAQAAQSQSPFSAVLCCTDSRVVPEVIFDQGLGDLFVVCVAGTGALKIVGAYANLDTGGLEMPG